MAEPLDLPALLDSWALALTAARKAPGTIRMYRAGVDRFLRWCADNNVTPELTKPLVQSFVADLLANGAEPATAHARLKGLRRFSAWLADEGELPANPLAGIKPVAVDTKVTEALSDEQLRAMLATCATRSFKDCRDAALIRFMAETGARASEVVGIHVDDVDLRAGSVVIRRGKGGKGRIVPISAQTATAIDRYMRVRRTHRLAGRPELWLGVGGKSFGYHGLEGSMKARAKLAGINTFHLHLLRHTAATRWLRAGGSEGGLMAVAGWSRRDILDRYVAASAAERAADEARRLNLGDL